MIPKEYSKIINRKTDDTVAKRKGRKGNYANCPTVFVLFVCLIVFNVTFNNISVISWRSVFLAEETGGPGESHQPVASHCGERH